jgi:hypothetical protein
MKKSLKLVNLLNIMLLVAFVCSSALSLYFKELPYLEATTSNRDLAQLGFALSGMATFLIIFWLTYRLSLAEPFSKYRKIHPWLASGCVFFFIIAPISQLIIAKLI